MLQNDNNQNNRIVFLTGTRADYGKMKSLIRAVNNTSEYEAYIFATGMHMLSKYGATYKEIVKDGFPNIYTFVNQNNSSPMDLTLSNTITGFSNYVAEIQPKAIVVHGDRLEALAGAIVGAFNNIHVLHIEGGEVSGTIDESIRHAVTKFSHYHFVSNEEAKKRIKQLGEPEDNIIIFGSPDIDIMHSDKLPTFETVCKHYEIPFTNYNIFMYHPVTTELPLLSDHIKAVVDGLLESNDNYVVVYPNNDAGSQIVLNEFERLKNNPRFRIFPSIRFEAFLTLLKNTTMLIGNSSSGIREACIYGKPAIDIGTRQDGRYNLTTSPHIIHIPEDKKLLLKAIEQAKQINLKKTSYYGQGNSDSIFVDALKQKDIFSTEIQKRFIDVDF